MSPRSMQTDEDLRHMIKTVRARPYQLLNRHTQRSSSSELIRSQQRRRTLRAIFGPNSRGPPHVRVFSLEQDSRIERQIRFGQKGLKSFFERQPDLLRRPGVWVYERLKCDAWDLAALSLIAWRQRTNTCSARHRFHSDSRQL